MQVLRGPQQARQGSSRDLAERRTWLLQRYWPVFCTRSLQYRRRREEHDVEQVFVEYKREHAIYRS